MTTEIELNERNLPSGSRNLPNVVPGQDFQSMGLRPDEGDYSHKPPMQFYVDPDVGSPFRSEAI